MIDRFRAVLNREGSRAFLRIPLNVWKETGVKGNGNDFIPITKKTLSALAPAEEYEVEMEPTQGLLRINHDSPYSKEHPLRKREGIEAIPDQAGFCGHCCVAMLAAVLHRTE